MRKLIVRFAKFFVISFFAWLVLVPNINTVSIAMGCFVALVAGSILSYAVDLIFYKHILNFFGYFTKIAFYRYIAFMIKEILLSTYDALKAALNFSHPYHSQIVKITLPKQTTVDKSLLITLSIIMTPGTTIVDINGKELAVHCLTKNAHNAMTEMLFVYKILSFNF